LFSAVSICGAWQNDDSKIDSKRHCTIDYQSQRRLHIVGSHLCVALAVMLWCTLAPKLWQTWHGSSEHHWNTLLVALLSNLDSGGTPLQSLDFV